MEGKMESWGCYTPKPPYLSVLGPELGGVCCREAALTACGAVRLGGRLPLALPLAGRRYGVAKGIPHCI